MGLKRYEVEVGNRRHPYKTTMLLSDEDAVHMGLIKEKAAKAPANKARTAQNKAAKPSGVKPVSAPAADDASDPDASE